MALRPGPDPEGSYGTYVIEDVDGLVTHRHTVSKRNESGRLVVSVTADDSIGTRRSSHRGPPVSMKPPYSGMRNRTGNGSRSTGNAINIKPFFPDSDAESIGHTLSPILLPRSRAR